jgi:hypothetical protein
MCVRRAVSLDPYGIGLAFRVGRDGIAGEQLRQQQFA